MIELQIAEIETDPLIASWPPAKRTAFLENYRTMPIEQQAVVLLCVELSKAGKMKPDGELTFTVEQVAEKVAELRQKG